MLYEHCFINVSYFPFLDIISNNKDIILEELNKVIENKHLWYKAEELHDVLSVFPIYFFGEKSIYSENLCPKTVNLLQSITHIYGASFSYLPPNTQLKPHVGLQLTNNMARCHFGLIVPNNCGLVCENYVSMHKLFSWIIFDDTKTHSAFNFSDKDRYILSLDVKRPDYLSIGKSISEYKYIYTMLLPKYFNNIQINNIKNQIDVYFEQIKNKDDINDKS